MWVPGPEWGGKQGVVQWFRVSVLEDERFQRSVTQQGAYN
jgi:hypothetical protein